MRDLPKIFTIIALCLIGGYFVAKFGFYMFFEIIDSRIERQLSATCESKGEVLESFRYDEDKKQIILQCVR